MRRRRREAAFNGGLNSGGLLVGLLYVSSWRQGPRPCVGRERGVEAASAAGAPLSRRDTRVAGNGRAASLEQCCGLQALDSEQGETRRETEVKFW